jgi:Mg/Co/Ni transporter MgtE
MLFAIRIELSNMTAVQREARHNLEWLLEGKGRIFQKDRITLNQNMTAAELAAVVRTLPEAEQQTIEAAVDRLLKEREL